MKKLLSLLLLVASLPLAAINWSNPATISHSGINASNPAMGMDSSGNAVAIWLENGALVASTLPVNGSWTTPVTLVGGGSSAPQIAVDPNGNGTAIWVQGGAILTATKTFNQSWGSTTTLASSGSSVPQIGVDTNGNVVAVWVNGGVIYSSTKLFGQSWPDSPTTLSTTTEADAPQIAIGAGGDVVAIWHSMWPTTNMNTIFVATNTIGGGWSSASPISNSYQNSVYPQVAVDPNGNATAIWFTYNMAGDNAYVNVMVQTALMDSANSLWSDPLRLSGPACCNPANLMAKVQYDSLGNAIALWTSSYNGTQFNLQLAYMQLSFGTIIWVGPSTLTYDSYGYAFDFAVTANSDVFATYMLTDTSSNVSIQAAQSHVGGWSSGYWANATEISNTTANISPQIAAVALSNNSSYATAIWAAYNGTNMVIQASSGSQSNLLPPSNLSVSQSVNSFGAFNEYYNTLNWQASSDSNVSTYIVFRNGVMLTTVKSSVLQYVDHNQPQNGAAVYSVSASDITGHTQSSIISSSFPKSRSSSSPKTR